MDVRVQDYLDDRLQSIADFETLDTLLESVQASQVLLKQQLDDAQRGHASEYEASQANERALASRIDSFQKEQDDIDRRMLQIMDTQDTDEAVEKFKSKMDRLNHLDIISGYVDMMLEVQRLTAECKTRLAASDQAALAPYYQLQRLHVGLKPLQEAAEGAAPHLIDHIANEVYTLRQDIQTRFAQDLETTLKAMQWPKTSAAVPIALQGDFEKHLGRLLDLQKPELETLDIGAGYVKDPPPLIALEVLVKPLEQRFAYHFSGNKPTNRLDKPEYFLNHICDLLDGYSNFLATAVQPVLVKHFRTSSLASIPACIDATSAFITAILPMVQHKLADFATQVQDQPNLLSHLVHEVIAFDRTMVESFAYTPVTPTMPWRGLAFYLLDTCSYFESWLNAEKEFALTRYQSIIDAADAGELDYDSVSAEATKPSKAAIRVNDLLETITEQYRDLSSFSQKLRFLIDIQIAVFDKFHARLHSSLEAYMTMTSSVARTMHGISKDDQRELQGVKGLDRLCRIFGSSDYLERAMRDWSDDVFFLELWDELQGRASRNKGISQHLGSIEEVRSKTSTAIDIVGDGDVKGALFDETADAYKRLRVRSESIIVETLTWNTREALKAYNKVNTWSSLSGTSTGSSLTAEIEPASRLITEYLGFLSRALGRLPFRRVVRSLCHSVQNNIWDQVLLRHSFSTAGARQFQIDVSALCQAINQYLGPQQAQAAMHRLCDGLVLLNLPEGGPKQAEVENGDDDDAAAAWEVDMEESDQAPAGVGLWEAERLIFKDNENARTVLERLGLEVLTEHEARQVLEKRVETSI